MSKKKVRLRTMGPVGLPSHANVMGLAPLKKLGALQIGRSQDRLAASSRRILLQGGLNGGNGFIVGENEDPAGLINPDNETPWKVAGPATIRLNPGCVMVLRAVFWPAGYTQEDDGGGGYDVVGAAGSIQAAVTWNSGISGSTATTHELVTPPSTDPLHSKPTGKASAWGALRREEVVVSPPGWAIDADNTRLYGAPGTTAVVTINYIGAPRVAYWVLYELPHELVTNWTDDYGAWGGMTDQGGKALGQYPSEFPVTRLSEDASGDDYGGSLAGLGAAEGFYTQVHGGGIFWFAGGEHIDDIADIVSLGDDGDGEDMLPGLDFTGGAANVLDDSATEWVEGGRGWPVQCLGYAAGYDASQIDGTRSVLCEVEVAWKSGGGTATLRVQTAPHSFVVLSSNDTNVHVTRLAYRFDVGPSPWDFRTLQAIVEVIGDVTATIYWFRVTPLPPG